jgi:hypothetical protein
VDHWVLVVREPVDILVELAVFLEDEAEEFVVCIHEDVVHDVLALWVLLVKH